MSSISSQQLMTGEVDSRSMCINLTDTLFMEGEETYDIVMSSLCSVEVTSNLDQVISDAGYEVMLDNVSTSFNFTDTFLWRTGRHQGRHTILLCHLYVLSRSQVI